MTEAVVLRESHTRSVLKGVTWRFVASATTYVISWRVTGDVSASLLIMSIEFFAKVFIYYLHERVWQLVPRGTIRGAIKKLLGRK